MRRLTLLLGCVVLLILPARAQAVPGTAELQRLAQPRLEEFRRFYEAKQFREAANVLHELYATPGMDRLTWEWTNILYNLSCCHALLGEPEQALSFLERAAASGISDPAGIEKDTDLAGLRDSPRYRKIVERLRSEWALWQGGAPGSAYRDTLSEDERLWGLARVWSEVRYNFANFDRVPDLNWDSLYVAFIPRVRAVLSTQEYYLLLQEMCVPLRDGHTGIQYPGELFARLYSRPPLDTRLVEGRVFVARVLADSLARLGIRPGLEIVRVDGVPVREYGEQHIAPREPASTPQQRDAVTYEYYLLCGAYKQPVEVEFADARGRTVVRTLRRSYTRILSFAEDLEFRMLPGNVAYVALNSFGNEKVVAVFDSLLPGIRKSNALIIDLRRNSGGNGGYALDILATLTDAPFRISAWKTREYRPLWRAWGLGGGWRVDSTSVWANRGKEPFRGPVVVLMGAQTGSAAEDLCVAFDVMKRGEMVGGPTAGTTGQPLLVPLPGGGSVRVCSTRNFYPDGREFVGVGVQPDVVVRETVRDVIAGRDAVLEAALERLKRNMVRKAASSRMD